MPNWKKVLVSGSNAELGQVTASVGFKGDGSGLINVPLTTTVENGTSNIHYLTFVDNASGGTQQLQTDDALKYMPSADLIIASSSVALKPRIQFTNTSNAVNILGSYEGTNAYSTQRADSDFTAGNSDNPITMKTSAGSIQATLFEGAATKPKTSFTNDSDTFNILSAGTSTLASGQTDTASSFKSSHSGKPITIQPSTGTVGAISFKGEKIELRDSTSNSTYYTTLTAGNIAASRNIQLPITDGTLMLTTDAASKVTLAAESTNAERFVTFGETAGDYALKIDAGLKYNPSTNKLSTDVIGDLTGNADTATTATNVVITDNESTNEDNAIVFVANADTDGSTSIGLESDGNLTYNPSTGRLTATQLAGDGSALTNLPAPPIETYNTSGDNRIITSVNSNTVQGEEKLLFNGSLLQSRRDDTNAFQYTTGGGYNSNASSLLLEQSGSGDVGMVFAINADGGADIHWRTYVDNSDSEKYKIGRMSTGGGTGRLEVLQIDSDGDTILSGSSFTLQSEDVGSDTSITIRNSDLGSNTNNTATLKFGHSTFFGGSIVSDKKTSYVQTSAADSDLVFNVADGNVAVESLRLSANKSASFSGNLFAKSIFSDSYFLTLENTVGGMNADAGIRVNGSTSAYTGSLLWDWDNYYWKAGNIGSEEQIVTVNAAQTLTSKTLTTPIISSISNTGTLTLPTSTGTLARIEDTVTGATKITVTDNESTNENNLIAFVAGASTTTGLQDLEMDGDLKYNPSTGKLTSTKFAGDGSELTNLPAPAVVTYNDSGNNRILTSVDSTSIKGEDALLFDGATLTVTGELDVDDIIINGSTIGHTNDTDLMTLSNGKLVIAGDLEIQGTTTTVSSTEVSIADKILTLNAGSAAGDGGIYVNDADAAETGSLLWDVSTDRWIGGLKDSEVTIPTISSIDTLTNKTLTTPVISTITTNGNTLTLPTDGAGTLARTTDNVASATILATARNIGGVSFNGSADITLPGVNSGGNQDTSGTAAIATLITVTDNENTAEENLITFVGNGNDSTGNHGLEMDGQLTYNPSTGTLSSTVFSGNLSGTATNANHVLVTDNENTNENNLITFVENAQDGTGNHGLEMDGQLYYNPSSGTVTATGFAGNLSGNATTATQLANARNIGGVSFNGGADIDLPGVNTTGNQDTSGNAATTTQLATARNIGGVSFNGTSDITLPGVNSGGNQDTSGNAATATKITSITNSDIVQLTTTQTLTSKTLTSPVLNTGVSGTAIKDEDNMASDSATHLATQQSIKAYVDASVTAQDLDIQGDTGGALSIDLDSESLTIAGGTGIDSVGGTNTITLNIDSTVTTLAGLQTLTNKTLTTPIISTISNTGTITLPTSTDTLVGRATIDTLTNKTLTSPVLTTPNVGTVTAGTWNGTVIASQYLDSDTAHLTTDQTFTGKKTFSNAITGSHFSGSSISTGSFGHVHIIDGDSGLGIGDDNDLLLYHDGSNSYIKDNGTGNLNYMGGTQTFQNAAGSKTMMVLNAANSVDLHFNDSKKLETTNDGVSVTGDMSVSGKLTAQEFHTTVTSASITYADGSNKFGNSTDDIHSFTGSLVVTGSISGSHETSASFGNIFALDNIEAMGTGSFRTLNVVNQIESQGRVTAPGLTSTANNIFVDTTVTGILNVVGNITGSNFSGSSVSTGSFGTIKVDDTTKVDNLNADLLDGQTGTYYTDFSNMAVSDDEIPIAKLASDNVSYGGVTLALGGTDATPAFNLSDATAYVGDSSLVTTGTITTGVWNSSFGAVSNTLISGSWKGNNSIDISADTNLAVSTGITLTDDTLTTNDSAIVHDDLSGFVADEHINHTAVDITAGTGLTGGGDISTTRTLNVVGGTGITANADNITTNDSEIVHDDLSGFVTNEHIDHSGVSITAGTGLTGGGTIESTRTLNVVGGTGITANADDIAIDFGDSTLQTTISGSFTEVSGGFSTRITNTELSASHSSSVATRLTDLEDNTNDVTLGGSLDYLTINNQVITRNAIDLSTDVTGTLPLSGTGLVAGTNITLSTNTLNVDDAFIKNDADDSTTGKITAGGFITSGHVTASLGVSGSLSSTGSFGRIEPAGDLVPKIHNTSDLGSPNKRWANIYSQDLQLSNENADGNEVDGTTGSWTIQEGSDDLYLLNRKNGKKYRFKLEEIT